jgi:hypothetical protein
MLPVDYPNEWLATNSTSVLFDSSTYRLKPSHFRALYSKRDETWALLLQKWRESLASFWGRILSVVTTVRKLRSRKPKQIPFFRTNKSDVTCNMVLIILIIIRMVTVQNSRTSNTVKIGLGLVDRCRHFTGTNNTQTADQYLSSCISNMYRSYGC